jgi:hypothetical protein
MTADFLEIFKQMSFLSSVLAGFALTAAVQLISLNRKGRLLVATIAVFIISSVLSAAATTIFVMVMTATLGSPGFPQPSSNWITYFVGGIGVLPMLGLLFFLAGVGLVGWLRSRLLGIITAVSAAIGMGMVIYFLVSLSASR